MDHFYQQQQLSIEERAEFEENDETYGSENVFVSHE
jgi:hypothetical protein